MTQAAMAAAPDEPRWSYTGDTGPAHWADIDDDFRMCGLGHNQSPVDIQGAIDAELPPLQLDYATNGTRVVNNGHTVQVASAEGNTLALDGDLFTLQQMHFHAPSEHTIDGRRFPLEAHLVHSDKDGNLAVVTVLFEEAEENAALRSLADSLPDTAGERADVAGMVNFTKILPARQEYFRLNGSLTTPPCSEGVRWVIMQTPQGISAEQVEAFSTAIGEANHRPLQPLNARVPLK
ncbi:MAG: carbonic anhydrase family protein [Gammaproteobacteria bacterium]|nr:carbonic anhydrase family protein [Gammaproteobacteria bacterium]